nr:hypothetical protein [Bacillus sp. LS15-K4]
MKADEIEDMAIRLNEIGFTFKNHLNKTILIKLFGTEFGDKIYPDERIVPRKFEETEEKVMKKIKEEIDKRGFAIKEELEKNINIVYRKKAGKEKVGKVVKLSVSEKKKIIDKLFKTIIPQSYQVKKVRGEEQKGQLGYTGDKTIITVVYK